VSSLSSLPTLDPLKLRRLAFNFFPGFLWTFLFSRDCLRFYETSPQPSPFSNFSAVHVVTSPYPGTDDSKALFSEAFYRFCFTVLRPSPALFSFGFFYVFCFLCFVFFFFLINRSHSESYFISTLVCWSLFSTSNTSFTFWIVGPFS